MCGSRRSVAPIIASGGETNHARSSTGARRSEGAARAWIGTGPGQAGGTRRSPRRGGVRGGAEGTSGGRDARSRGADRGPRGAPASVWASLPEMRLRHHRRDHRRRGRDRAAGARAVKPPAPGERVARSIEVRGVVQGVGFRPFVWRLAAELGLDGSVVNRAGQVVIEVGGP